MIAIISAKLCFNWLISTSFLRHSSLKPWYFFEASLSAVNSSILTRVSSASDPFNCLFPSSATFNAPLKLPISFLKSTQDLSLFCSSFFTTSNSFSLPNSLSCSSLTSPSLHKLRVAWRWSRSSASIFSRYSTCSFNRFSRSEIAAWSWYLFELSFESLQ